MSNQPAIFDTSNLDNSSFQQMAQQLAQTISSGQNYSVTGPNAGPLLNAAFAINGNINPQTGQVASVSTPSNSIAGSPTQSASYWEQSKALAYAVTSPDVAATAIADKAKSAMGDWISAHAGNYGLIIFGALLALGALLISQRETVLKVAKTAAEVSA